MRIDCQREYFGFYFPESADLHNNCHCCLRTNTFCLRTNVGRVYRTKNITLKMKCIVCRRMLLMLPKHLCLFIERRWNKYNKNRLREQLFLCHRILCDHVRPNSIPHSSIHKNKNVRQDISLTFKSLNGWIRTPNGSRDFCNSELLSGIFVNVQRRMLCGI